ncbi:HD domain-containing protein [Jannaschia faecimaris]|nr:HD domain-containing protein [Jannaschia faecimaris]
MSFLKEADRLKSVMRATRLADGSRHENSAEHSWHLTLYALTLADHAPSGVRIERVVRMLILHDLVEIDAGDTPIFGTGSATQDADEQAAADRIFGLLPEAQARDFRELWDEFEAAETPDAVFAKSLDRFQPPTLNLANGGGSWTDYSVEEHQVRARIGLQIERGAPTLWGWLSPRIAAFFAR